MRHTDPCGRTHGHPGKFEKVNTLFLTRAGSIYINSVSYPDLKENRKKFNRILKRLTREL